MMKRISAFFFLLTCFGALAQQRQIDSLYPLLEQQKTDTDRIKVMYALSHAFQQSRPDSALLIAQEANFLSNRIKYVRGQSWSLNQMAVAYNALGNFPKSLQNYIEQLKIEEKLNNPEDVGIVYLDIAVLYHGVKDYEKALQYAKISDSIFKTANAPSSRLYSLLNIGEIFEKQNKLDSALSYTMDCYQHSQAAGTDLVTGTALNNLGNIYFKVGNYIAAVKNYEAAVGYITVAGDDDIYSESLLGIAKIYAQRGATDSALLYGRQAYNIANRNQFLIKALDASEFLAALYKHQPNIDSAFAYQQVMMTIRDSMESRERIKAVQNISMDEELRQKELSQLKITEARDRREKLQLLIIGIFIPIFFLVSVFISRKKVHKKLIEFTGIISILLFFEYITLLLHPFIAEKSNHSPVIEIIVFVAIAAIITPVHHRIERWLLAKLHELNALKHHHAEVPARPET